MKQDVKITIKSIKEKELTRIMCAWNRKEKSPEETCGEIWKLYEKECLETWNDPLEKLLTPN